MKKAIVFSSVVALAFAACKKDIQQANPGTDLSLNAATSFVDTIVLPQIINANMTLTPQHLYVLDGKVYVTGGTLSIQAGTQLEGVYKSVPAEASALIITKTGKISAKGKENNPVIFTSHLAGLPGGRTNRQPGDWGGVVLLGDAPTNKPASKTVEGIETAIVPAGVDVTYGGSNPDHSAGVLAYARIEFAGAVVLPNNELNSLTCAGVGKKTGLKYIMASYGADDAFEFFGGNSEPRYLIANSQNDDAFDFDFGFVGNLQFAVSVRNSAYAFADANGIECDNENPSAGATPTTRPQLSNLTIVGNSVAPITGSLNAARFRRGTDLRVRNSIFIGYNTGIAFENTLVATTPLFFRNNAVHAFVDSAKFVASPTVGPWGISNLAVVGAYPTSWLNNANPATHATYKSSALVYKVGGPFDPANASGLKPNYSGLATNFLSGVPYIGALGPGAPIRDSNGLWTIPNNWIAGSTGAWVNFDPQ
ncbi:hypothetical protein [Flavihumibacter solisilvae]|uniref:hypothetical protein n=1 Tax=Flavihumibacter solisilvae TaxID=1349421 RepID=UPI00068AC3FD|nr:hypothetical protein [Flavihumibacter solisilvae]